MKKTYNVTFSVEGYYSMSVEAEDEDEARDIALEDSYDIDCGDLEDIDWDICKVECEE